MKEEMKGLYAAIVVSLAVILITNWLFPSKNVAQPQKTQNTEISVSAEIANPEANSEVMSTEAVIAKDIRIKIKNNVLTGTLRVKGARFDDLYLAKYKQSLDDNSGDVELLAPAQTDAPYYAEFGWLSTDVMLTT